MSMFLLPADGTGILLREHHIPTPLIFTFVALLGKTQNCHSRGKKKHFSFGNKLITKCWFSRVGEGGGDLTANAQYSLLGLQS